MQKPFVNLESGIAEIVARVARVARVAAFVRRHPGFYVSHCGRGVTIAIDCVIPATGERWKEFQTVRTMRAARAALGY